MNRPRDLAELQTLVENIRTYVATPRTASEWKLVADALAAATRYAESRWRDAREFRAPAETVIQRRLGEALDQLAGVPLMAPAEVATRIGETSSACRLVSWCNRQVGHAGPCSPNMLPDGSVVP